MDERAALLTLHLIPGIGPTTVFALRERFESYGEVVVTVPTEWPVAKHIVKSAQAFLAKFSLESFEQRLELLNQKFITWDDEQYPDGLKNIANPPMVLFYRGEIGLLKSACIAIVGTRHPSLYGEKVVRHVVPPLVMAGQTIVSGFQLGVDQLAHRAVLDAKGKTVAVLGTGLDIPYPNNSLGMYAEICEKGLIISEFPPGTPPEKGNFPRRNRIVSGISSAVVIVEAALKSGSLVTAQHALEQGKDIYAVPGSIFTKYAEGCHYLIKEGARLLTCAQDILGGEIVGVATVQKAELIEATLQGWKKELYLFIAHASPNLDECIEKFQRPMADLLTALSEFELGNMVRKLDDGSYVLV